mgnify:CR=1 FL=1
MNKLILASNSLRRKELMNLLNLEYDIIVSQVDEIINKDLSKSDLVMDLAFQKALDVFKTHKDDLVLGFDTLVYLDDEILGKPKSKEEAKNMLQMLSNQTNEVITGCALICKSFSKSFFEKTRVTFYPLTESEIDDYIASNEPFDKAGAYGIQGLGGKFIKGIYGDYYTVMGLPLSRVYHELTENEALKQFQNNRTI